MNNTTVQKTSIHLVGVGSLLFLFHGAYQVLSRAVTLETNVVWAFFGMLGCYGLFLALAAGESPDQPLKHHGFLFLAVFSLAVPLYMLAFHIPLQILDLFWADGLAAAVMFAGSALCLQSKAWKGGIAI